MHQTERIPFLPLDPKTIKNEGFRPQNMGETTPKNEGTMGSHARTYLDP